MGQQLLFNQAVHVTQRKTFGTRVKHYSLSDPSMVVLSFGWKNYGSHFHLYRRDENGEMRHVFQANTLDEVINKAQVV